MRRLVLASTKSGGGKTTLSCALLFALKSRGFHVAAWKCGPDYLDPLFAQAVLKVPTGNLDSFFSDRRTLRRMLAKEESDFALIEGVMGYFDGVGMGSTASTYEIAELTDTPVVLILDCAGRAASVFAELKGFLETEKERRIKGVLFNRLSPMLYEEAARRAEELGVVPVGYLPRLPEAEFPDRHLGLVRPEELSDFEARIERLSARVFETVSLEKIVRLSEEALSLTETEQIPAPPMFPDLRLAIADDLAFCFCYRENRRAFAERGVALIPFSPIKDRRLPECDGLLLPGGYPELYAKELSENTSMKESVRMAIKGGLPTIAECGGFLYLHRTLRTEDGETYPMTGVLEDACEYRGFQPHFGYVSLTAESDYLLAPAGQELRGHEFHYFVSGNDGDALLAKKPESTRHWRTGFISDTLYAGFPHLFLAGNTGAVDRFCNAMRQRRSNMV